MLSLKDINKFEERLEKSLEGVVDSLESSSDKIYSGVSSSKLNDLKQEPTNKIVFGILFLLLSLSCGSYFYSLATQGYWQKTSAYLSYLSIVPIEINSSNPRGPFDYEVNIRYSYRHKGKLYSGTRFYADGNPIFDKVSYIESLLQNKKKGEEIFIYVDPQRPWFSAVVAGGFSPIVFFKLLGVILFYGLVLIYGAQFLRVF